MFRVCSKSERKPTALAALVSCESHSFPDRRRSGMEHEPVATVFVVAFVASGGLRNGTGAAAGKAGESRGVCELALWPARVISYAALAVTFWEQNS